MGTWPCLKLDGRDAPAVGTEDAHGVRAEFGIDGHALVFASVGEGDRPDGLRRRNDFPVAEKGVGDIHRRHDCRALQGQGQLGNRLLFELGRLDDTLGTHRAVLSQVGEAQSVGDPAVGPAFGRNLDRRPARNCGEEDKTKGCYGAFHQACRFLTSLAFSMQQEKAAEPESRMSVRGPLQPDNIPQTGRGKLTLPHPARGPLSSESSDFVRTNQQAFSLMRQL